MLDLLPWQRVINRCNRPIVYRIMFQRSPSWLVQ